MTGGAGVTQEGAVRCPCGRLLRDPVSRARGLGPVCFKRLQARTRPRPRLIGTPTAVPHPTAVPGRSGQLAFEVWDDPPDDEPDRARRITDVPTGAMI